MRSSLSTILFKSYIVVSFIVAGIVAANGYVCAENTTIVVESEIDDSVYTDTVSSFKNSVANSDTNTVKAKSENEVNQSLPKELIDINHAELSQLIQLPGIGPVIAERIISYRNTVAEFKSIKDLENVKGIGEKKSAAMADFIKF